MFVYLNGRRVWTELNAADSGGNDGGGDGDRDQAFQRLLDRKNSDGISLARELFTENYNYRRNNEELKRQVGDLQGKAAPEGAVMLTGDNAKAWIAYQALGKPEEVKQGLDERTQLQGKVSAQEREALIRGVAEAAGYKPAVLANLDRVAKAEGKTLGFELRDTTVDGKVVKVPYVKDGDNASPLTDYAVTNWADFMPALSVQGTQQQQPAGTRFPLQHAATGTQGGQDFVDKFLTEQQTSQAAVKNPLLKGQ